MRHGQKFSVRRDIAWGKLRIRRAKVEGKVSTLGGTKGWTGTATIAFSKLNWRAAVTMFNALCPVTIGGIGQAIIKSVQPSDRTITLELASTGPFTIPK